MLHQLSTKSYVQFIKGEEEKKTLKRSFYESTLKN